MSLNGIQLPALVLQELFAHSLIDTGQANNLTGPVPGLPFAYLGNNQKNVAIIVDYPESVYCTDEELNFLLNILSACKLTMEDIALLNHNKNPNITYQDIFKHLHAVKILLIGVSPADIQLPMDFPYYQIQRYNNQVYLSAPGLKLIKEDREQKTRLWVSLKQVFSIT